MPGNQDAFMLSASLLAKEYENEKENLGPNSMTRTIQNDLTSKLHI